jgi:hypothetical protein
LEQRIAMLEGGKKGGKKAAAAAAPKAAAAAGGPVKDWRRALPAATGVPRYAMWSPHSAQPACCVLPAAILLY